MSDLVATANQRHAIDWRGPIVTFNGDRCFVSHGFSPSDRIGPHELTPSYSETGGHYDFYETTYQSGVMWFTPRALREGRGGDSGWAFTGRVKSRMLETHSLARPDWEACGRAPARSRRGRVAQPPSTC